MEKDKFEPWMDAYHALGYHFMRAYESWTQEFGISIYDYMVLTYIYEHEERCTQQIIANERSMPIEMVKSILRKFENWGMLELISDYEDKRSKLIKFTDIGIETAHRIISYCHDIEKDAYTLVGKEKWDTFKMLGEEIALTFEKIVGEDESNLKKRDRDNRT